MSFNMSAIHIGDSMLDGVDTPNVSKVDISASGAEADDETNNVTQKRKTRSIGRKRKRVDVEKKDEEMESV